MTKILLDVMMPDEDGWSVLSTIKADEELRHCPVIMLSVNDDIQKGRTLGASAHLLKPVDREPLLRVLKQLHTSDEKIRAIGSRAESSTTSHPEAVP